MKALSVIFLGIAFFFILNPLTYATTDGTTGTPLGGLGTGAVKFNAGRGTFAYNDRTPTRYGDYRSLTGAQFQLFTRQNGTVLTETRLAAAKDASGRVKDDAAFPTHQASFSPVNDVEISLQAFAPFDPTQSDNMAMPCVFYEFTFLNTGHSETEVSIAFQLTTEQNPVIDDAGGFVDSSGVHQKCILVNDSDGTAVVTVGGGNAFFESGTCENSITDKTNRVAAYFKLQPQSTKTILFVLSWFNTSDPSRYYYTNFYANAIEAAKAGLSHAEDFKNNAGLFVNRMRSSNLPEWIVDQALNSLVNLVNNSIYTADGRYCHNEGMYLMNGTMDQMWHARQINIMLLPDIAWKELEYWARCQKKTAGTEGQIHHDFGSNSTYTIAEWDETDYVDYRDINKWVDLNCGFIISIYEAYIATANQEKLNLLWPYVKKAGQRILNQVNLYGDHQYPYTFSDSESSYDAGGNSQAYNTGLSIATYKILMYLAHEMGETDLVSQYNIAFTTAVENFSKRWLQQQVETSNYCESMLGGPWIANFLKLGQFWPTDDLDLLYYTINYYYNPLENGLGLPGGSYSEWQTYLVAHLGGYSLQTGRSDVWNALQFDMYKRNFLDRNRVFNQELGVPSTVTSPTYIATNSSGSDQYISIPFVWRNYYDIVGYHRNQVTGELWLEPNLPDMLNHELTNATVISPEGFATIFANENGEKWQNQQITFIPEQIIHVDTLYVKDKYGDKIESVTVNDTQQSFTRVGEGYQRRLKIHWSGDVDAGGLVVAVIGEPPEATEPEPPEAPTQLQATAHSTSTIDLVWNDNATNELGFYVECKIGESFTQMAMLSANDTSFSHTGLLPNQEYIYRVVAYNQDGTSGYSNEISATTFEANGGEVVFAVNSGGPDYTGSDGIQYLTDDAASFCSGGRIYSNSNNILGTTDRSLYQTERYGDFTYNIPLENDDYEVTFKFAEIYHDSPNSRKFSMTVERSLVLSEFDIFKMAGKNVAYDVIIPVSLDDGRLTISFTTLADNAKLSALVVRKVSTSEINTDEMGELIPQAFQLRQNYPNPFNPTTTIYFDLPKKEHVKLCVFNVIGEEIMTLINDEMPAGTHSFTVNLKHLSSGVYFYSIETNSFLKTRRMMLLK